MFDLHQQFFYFMDPRLRFSFNDKVFSSQAEPHFELFIKINIYIKNCSLERFDHRLMLFIYMSCPLSHWCAVFTIMVEVQTPFGLQVAPWQQQEAAADHLTVWTQIGLWGKQSWYTMHVRPALWLLCCTSACTSVSK